MSLFHWCMRNAAGLLFAFAVILFLAGLLPFLLELGASFSRRASNLGETRQGDWTTLYGMLVATLGAAMWPLFGAGLLYRLDRREKIRATFGASDD